MTLKQLLRWAYGSQHADVAVGRSLDEIGWSKGVSGDGVYSLLVMGGRQDGGASEGLASVIWADRIAVHPDALAVHRVVSALPPLEAQMVIEFGRTGMFPEPAAAHPRAEPTPAVPPAKPHERASQCRFDGEEMVYRLEVVEVIPKVPVYRGKRAVHYVDWEVLWAPIFWWPDPAWYEMVQQIDRRWREIEAKLEAAFRTLDLVAHEVAAVNLPATTSPVA